MAQSTVVTVYTDYKSPYAYLAKDLAYALAAETGATLDWLPYTLDIPSFLGSAEIDEAGRVTRSERNAHQWRRVRYSYMDCRRQASKRGLTIRGTRKIWDSSLAGIGMLYAKRQGTPVFRAYNDLVFEQFWQRALDIEDPAVLRSALAESGADVSGFIAYLDGDGRHELNAVQEAAERSGVFGVPSFVIGAELFWGREHLSDIRALIDAG